jgi:hypothetical protein
MSVEQYSVEQDITLLSDEFPHPAIVAGLSYWQRSYVLKADSTAPTLPRSTGMLMNGAYRGQKRVHGQRDRARWIEARNELRFSAFVFLHETDSGCEKPYGESVSYSSGTLWRRLLQHQQQHNPG